MPNIRLDPIAPRHAEAVQELASHPYDGAITWIKAVQERRDEGTDPFAILNEKDTLVGVTGLVDVSGDTGEVGFWIGKPYWNRGYATAGTRRLFRFEVDELGTGRFFDREQ